MGLDRERQNMNEVYGISFTAVLIGVSLILVGAFIKKTKSAELISGYDVKKDSSNKEFLSEIFGNGMMLMGIISLISTLPYFIITKSATNEDVVGRNSVILMIVIILNIILITAKLYYLMNKKRKSK